MPLKLHIVRHAKASSEDYFPGDFYRTLDSSGYKEASAMASWFAVEHGRPDQMITSPAIRAYTTCLIFAEKVSYPYHQIVLNNSIYEAPFEKLLRAISESHDNCKTIVLFGHNPGLTDLINYLCGPVLNSLATSGIATIDFENTSWQRIGEGSGTMVTSVKP